MLLSLEGTVIVLFFPPQSLDKGSSAFAVSTLADIRLKRGDSNYVFRDLALIMFQIC